MKKIFIYLVLLSSAFVACDIVDPREIDEDGGGGGEVPELPIVPRSVLLEEFTGFKCANCPAAADQMKALKKQYAGRVELLTIHWGTFARTLGTLENEKDFTNATSEEIHNEFGIGAYPLIAISRQNQSGAFGRPSTKMEEEMFPVLFNSVSGNDVPDDLNDTVTEYSDIYIGVDPVRSGNNINIDTKLIYLDKSGNEDYLIHYVVEDSIVAAQLDARSENDKKLITDYVHTNTLRDNVNGVWGENLTSTQTFERGDSLSLNHQYQITDPEWNKDQLYILTLVTDGQVGVVKHVIKSKVREQ